MSGFWYLATPYRGFDPKGYYPSEVVRLSYAFLAGSKLAARLLDFQVDVYCPIAHSHPIAPYVKTFGASDDAWLRIQGPFMEAAKGLLIGKLPGWDTSSGIAYERRHFAFHEKPEFLLEPDFSIIPGEIRR